MTFGESIKTCLSKYVTFEGRASRSEFWWFMLFQFLVTVVISFVSSMLGGLASLALLVPTVAAQARRLHDIGKSGWLMLIGLIPVLGWIVVIYWSVQPSAPEANEYGQAPEAPAP